MRSHDCSGGVARKASLHTPATDAHAFGVKKFVTETHSPITSNIVACSTWYQNPACVVELYFVASDELAGAFVHGGADCGGEVQGAFALGHGHEDALVGVGFEEFAGEAGGFAAKDEGVAWAESCVEVAGWAALFSGGFGGEEVELAFGGA